MREQIRRVADGYPLDWDKIPPMRAAGPQGAIWVTLRALIEELAEVRREMRKR
jgi:hypothetical protein